MDVCLCAYDHLCVRVNVCVSVCVFVCLYISLCVCVSVCAGVCVPRYRLSTLRGLSVTVLLHLCHSTPPSFGPDCLIFHNPDPLQPPERKLFELEYFHCLSDLPSFLRRGRWMGRVTWYNPDMGVDIKVC